MHKKQFPSPKVGEVLKCVYNISRNCEPEFEAWHGVLRQNVRGKKNNCCKYCLDYMRRYLEEYPDELLENFHEGFRKKSDKKAWKALSYKEQLEYVCEVADYGIAVYQPPEKL